MGVSGFDGGSGMPIKVGVFILGAWVCRSVSGFVALEMELKVGELMQELFNLGLYVSGGEGEVIFFLTKKVYLF